MESIITDLEVKCLEQVPIFVNVKIKLLELTKKIDSYVKEVQDTANMMTVRIYTKRGSPYKAPEQRLEGIIQYNSLTEICGNEGYVNRARFYDKN